MSVRDHGKAFTGIVYSRKGQRVGVRKSKKLSWLPSWMTELASIWEVAVYRICDANRGG